MGLRGFSAVAVCVLVALLGLAPPAVAAPDPEPDPQPVRVAVHTLEPFVMETGTGELTGFSIDLWSEIAKRLDWSTEYLRTDGVGGQLTAVAEDRAEVAVGAISLTADREQHFDFTQPTLDAGLQIIVPVHDTRPSVPGLAVFSTCCSPAPC